jgi:hypothetical protein
MNRRGFAVLALARNDQIAFIRAVLSDEYSLPVRMLLGPYRNSVLSGAQFAESDMRLLTRASWGCFAIAALFFRAAFLAYFRRDRPLLRIGPAATPFDACQNLLSHETPATDDAVDDVNNDR